MTRLGSLLHMMTAALFVTAGIVHAVWTARPLVSGPTRLAGSLVPTQNETSIPHLYLDPDNPLMWALLIAIWLMVLLDAAGQWIDPSDAHAIRAGGPRVWPLVALALTFAAIWPLMLGYPIALAAGTAAGAALAIVAARRAAGRHRPAIGFLAGWATAMASGALAALASQRLGLPMAAVSALAILPGAAVGMVAQIWIGPSIGYSAALIWAFCGLAISTMGSDPMIALAAILGISAMATVLVRAAS